MQWLKTTSLTIYFEFKSFSLYGSHGLFFFKCSSRVTIQGKKWLLESFMPTTLPNPLVKLSREEKLL
jgi:hypothetical protein